MLYISLILIHIYIIRKDNKALSTMSDKKAEAAAPKDKEEEKKEEKSSP
jgi:hypothetical protein